VTSELEGVRKWQRNWTQSTKGSTTKEYFSNVEERLKMELKLVQIFAAIVTGHGITKAYLHRFQIIEYPACTCRKAIQTTDHLIFDLKH